MNSANYVDQQIEILKQKGIPLADQVWEAALMCVGWPYVFGAWGAYCTTGERKKRYKPDHATIYSACQVLREKNPKKTCSGCKWYPNGERVRCFDCRGFTDWLLKQFGIDLTGEGCTGQWNCEDNWELKGTIDNLPEDKLVCLFYPDKKNPRKMAHTGIGYKGSTVECSSGVQYFETRKEKWTHWAIPKGLYGGDTPIIPPDDPTVKLPTLRKGDKGSYVTLLQTLLLNRGYKLPKYGADGSFGNETLAAVKQFQQDWGLDTDGVVGERTWELLESSPEKKLYTVTLKHLTREDAEAILKGHEGQMVLEN